MSKPETKKFNFTVRRIQRLTAAAKKVDYTDTGAKGLMLRVEPTGTKTWKWRGTDSVTGKRIMLTIGTYPAISIEAARNEAEKYNGKIETGKRPETAKQEAAGKESLQQLFERWYSTYAKVSKKTHESDKQRYELRIKPFFGDIPAAEITTEMVEKWRAEMLNTPSANNKDKNLAPGTVNRLVAILSSMYTKTAKSLKNPCSGLPKFKTESRDVFIKQEDLPRFIDALESPETPEWLQDLVWLALLTGARQGNLFSMHWSEISLEGATWTIPSKKFKNGKKHTINLNGDALAILRKRSQITSGYVFPPQYRRKSKSGHIVDINHVFKNLLERAEMTNLHFHDLRRTAGSIMVAAGVPALVTCETLGHGPEMIPVYQKLQDDATKLATSALNSKLREMIKRPETVKTENDIDSLVNQLAAKAGKDNDKVLEKIKELLAS